MIFQKIVQFFNKPEDHKSIKILVIEDSPVDQKIASIAIEQGGYSVLQAIDGKTGLEMAQARLPDLIILDYNLPDMNGPQICKKLKADVQTSHIPVLFLTSMDSPGSIIDCYEQGAENYLAKPINPKFLLKEINQALKERKTQS